MYRPIVDKCNLHHGLEDAVLHLFRCISLLDFAEKVMVQPFRLVRC